MSGTKYSLKFKKISKSATTIDSNPRGRITMFVSSASELSR